MVSRTSALIVWSLLGAGLAACGDDLPQGWQLGSPRVLGLRVEALDSGEPARAWPAIGETARFQFVVKAADPAFDPAELSWMVMLCGSSLSGCGLVDAPGNKFQGTASLADPVQLLALRMRGALHGTLIPGTRSSPAFDVKLTPALVQGETLAGFGAICTSGEPDLPLLPNDPPLICREAGSTLPNAIHLQRFTVTIQQPMAEANLHPTLPKSFRLCRADGSNDACKELPAYLPPEPASQMADMSSLAGSSGGGDCEPELPTVRAGSGTHELEITLDPGDRQVAEAGPEVLQIEHLTTHGTLDRLFSFVERDEQPDSGHKFARRVEWDPPTTDALKHAQQLVRFVVIVRDGRGGFDHAEIRVCVVK